MASTVSSTDGFHEAGSCACSASRHLGAPSPTANVGASVFQYLVDGGCCYLYNTFNSQSFRSLVCSNVGHATLHGWLATQLRHDFAQYLSRQGRSSSVRPRFKRHLHVMVADECTLVVMMYRVQLALPVEPSLPMHALMQLVAPEGVAASSTMRRQAATAGADLLRDSAASCAAAATDVFPCAHGRCPCKYALRAPSTASPSPQPHAPPQAEAQPGSAFVGTGRGGVIPDLRLLNLSPPILRQQAAAPQQPGSQQLASPQPQLDPEGLAALMAALLPTSAAGGRWHGHEQPQLAQYAPVGSVPVSAASVGTNRFARRPSCGGGRMAAHLLARATDPHRDPSQQEGSINYMMLPVCHALGASAPLVWSDSVQPQVGAPLPDLQGSYMGLGVPAQVGGLQAQMWTPQLVTVAGPDGSQCVMHDVGPAVWPPVGGGGHGFVANLEVVCSAGLPTSAAAAVGVPLGAGWPPSVMRMITLPQQLPTTEAVAPLEGLSIDQVLQHTESGAYHAHCSTTGRSA